MSDITNKIEDIDERRHLVSKFKVYSEYESTKGVITTAREYIVYNMCVKWDPLQSLYYATGYSKVLVITRPGLGSQMVIFLLFLYKISPL